MSPKLIILGITFVSFDFVNFIRSLGFEFFHLNNKPLNLRYLKNAYHSIRTWEDKDHEIVILDDASVDGTVEWLDSLNDPNLIIWENETGKRLGHTITYDIGVDLCTTEVFSIFHADMFIGPNYVQNLVKHLDKQKVVAATRIEPPLHPTGKEKITRDFGMWPEDFR